ncbi:Type 1 glutamine amidotransferase-like domain-containing protein [Clostridioides sp. ZZV15-6598]|uniref:Type 1 glutamine amidotransferase-like domain-containing protein n=1 Tax=Clostridioides sp. ZZV15-6598 TaxID=2811501 RepID=UPI001D121589|nr:Type 1 glutamine amidotransferase-like domain-containing protein [Clostridioides sp. ZZV15-6598]
MKKMLLVSMFQNVSNILKTVEPNLKNKTVTYIPTASTVERLGFFVRIGKWRLKRLGLIVDELEISTSTYETIKDKLEKNDYIYVTGGNTFFLLQELKRTGADKLLIEEINKGKFYIGESAGAIVVAPNIEYSSEMDDIEKAPSLKDYSGLNLIDFYVVPHFQNWEFGKSVEKIVNAYSKTLELKNINDNQAILIENDSIRILDK